eukprot:1145544-Pelagomonas_calceolata.AAC.2
MCFAEQGPLRAPRNKHTQKVGHTRNCAVQKSAGHATVAKTTFMLFMNKRCGSDGLQRSFGKVLNPMKKLCAEYAKRGSMTPAVNLSMIMVGKVTRHYFARFNKALTQAYVDLSFFQFLLPNSTKHSGDSPNN